MGGSQGASAINSLIVKSLPILAKWFPNVQWLHLTGAAEIEMVKKAYATLGIKAAVRAFLPQMELALGAATVAVSRAGASSLAELAAMRVPSVLIPYPSATDNHQYYNARAFEQTGAARLLEQKLATPEGLAEQLAQLIENTGEREKMQQALAQWHSPRAAEQIAEAMLEAVRAMRSEGRGEESSK